MHRRPGRAGGGRLRQPFQIQLSSDRSRAQLAQHLATRAPGHVGEPAAVCAAPADLRAAGGEAAREPGGRRHAQVVPVEPVPAAGGVLVELDPGVRGEFLAGLVETLPQRVTAEVAQPDLVVSCLAARSPASFRLCLTAFVLSWAISFLKICWMAMRVAAIRPPAAGEAAPRVRATATAMPISSTTKMPSSIHASILAPSMSQPHSSTSLPSSWLIDRSALSGAFSSSDTVAHAAMNASTVTPLPPYPEMI